MRDTCRCSQELPNLLMVGYCASSTDADPEVAVGETSRSAAPPSSFSRCFNRDGEGASAK